MVFVKVRETYDLHTIRNKMTLIGIHTPKAAIIKRNYPGLLLQCKAYRPVKCDVRLACASMLPVDPLGVGTTEGEVAPEDLFNPILYKAVSNQSMSVIEQYLYKSPSVGLSAKGDSVDAKNDGFLSPDDFNLYYGLLSNTHEWKHASPQSGLSMSGLVPLVYEKLYTYGMNGQYNGREMISDGSNNMGQIADTGTGSDSFGASSFRGKPQRMPFMNTTYSWEENNAITPVGVGFTNAGADYIPNNYQTGVPAPKVYCGLIIVPPSRLHQLFYRLVCEWTLEFSTIRSVQDITTFAGIASVGYAQHTQDYDYSSSKVFTDDSSTDLVDTSSDSGIHKVM